MYSDPFPKYKHGAQPAICENGCEPVASASLSETWQQRLRREAVEMCEKYGAESDATTEVCTRRVPHCCRSNALACIVEGDSHSQCCCLWRAAEAHRAMAAPGACTNANCACTGGQVESGTPMRSALRMADVQAISMRKQQILDSIDKTGTYEHTVDELQWGIRVAWRNAAKCANRKFWDEIVLLDHRHAETPAEMFEVRSGLARCSCAICSVLLACLRPAVAQP